MSIPQEKVPQKFDLHGELLWTELEIRAIVDAEEWIPPLEECPSAPLLEEWASSFLAEDPKDIWVEGSRPGILRRLKRGHSETA